MRFVNLCAFASLAGLAVSASAQDRTIDGSDNNTTNTDWGEIHTEQSRLSTQKYNDGFGTMKVFGPSGSTLENPRVISNAVGQQAASGNSKDLSSMFWQWGQFIDHDLVLTEGGVEFAPMFAPVGDPTFSPGEMIPFTRSAFNVDGGGVRQMPNGITHWLDGSMVYGSDTTRATELRTMSNGRLKTGADNMMPLNTANLPVANDSGLVPNTALPLGGDVRAAEQTGLAAMHTLFVREHNRWADRLAGELDLSGLTATEADQKIYDYARAIVGAQVQKITYEDWLPAMLGDAELANQGLTGYSGYNDTVDPTISLEFSTAGFRFGHTMLNEELLRLNADGTEFAGGHLTLRDAFFDPSTMDSSVELDAILRGLAAQEAEGFDTQVIDSARSFLFGGPGTGGLDLLSANINRGRDHGLGSYNEVRADLGLAPATSFLDLTGGDATLAAALASVYAHVDDVDLIIGIFSEPKESGAIVGETAALIVGEQFLRLRDGDRYFYLNQDEFDLELLPYLDEATLLTLGDIMELNSDVSGLQGNVFFIPAPGVGGVLALVGLVASRRRRA